MGSQTTLHIPAVHWADLLQICTHCDALNDRVWWTVNSLLILLKISTLFGPPLQRGHLFCCWLWRRQEIRFLPVRLVLFHRIRLTSLTRTMLCPQRRATVKGAIPLLPRHAIHARSCTSLVFFFLIFNRKVNSLTDRNRDVNCGPRRNDGPQLHDRRAAPPRPIVTNDPTTARWSATPFQFLFLLCTWRHLTSVI
jgi:hypothetical protein